MEIRRGTWYNQTSAIRERGRTFMEYSIRTITIKDYDAIYALWTETEQSRRALNPVDDSREGIGRYLARNPGTCFAAVLEGRMIGVILTGHDGRPAWWLRRRKRCGRKESRRFSAWCSLTTRRPTPSGKKRDTRCGPT